MSEKTYSLDKGGPRGHMVVPGAQAVVFFDTSNDADKAAVAQPGTTQNVGSVLGGKVYPWGDDNQYPTMVRKKLEKSTLAYPVMYQIVSVLYGEGLDYYIEDKENGQVVKKFEKVEAVEKFLKNHNTTQWFISQVCNYRMFMQAFSQFIFSLNIDEDRISRLHNLDCELSRLSVKDEKDFKIKELYYGEWVPQNSDEDKFEKMPLFDELAPTDFIESVKKNKTSFAYWTKFPSPGRLYYAQPFWGGLYRTDGWLDVANDLPEILRGINKNQITIKYHVRIPLDYWAEKYPKWEEMEESKQEETIAEELNDMNDNLTGNSNQGKAFFTFHKTSTDGKMLPGWEITAIDDKLNKEAYIPTSDHADQQVIHALGYDSSLASLQPQGGKMGAGSGSDKRVGMLNKIALTKVEKDIILQPLNLVRDINGWDDRIRFTCHHKIPTTLNVDKSGVTDATA